MDPALVLAVTVAVVCGAPTILTGLAAAAGGLASLRPAPPRRVLSAAVLLLALRAVPSPAAPPPPGERLTERFREQATPPADPAVPVPEPAGARVTYRVVAGDSLWAIACRYLSARGVDPGDAEIDRAWRVIYAANLAVVGVDPDLIFPGQLLVIPPEV